jgi:predicted nucleotidyltransferase
MTGINEKDKEKIIALISALAPDAKIILFGSRARGRFSDFSDIDLALDMGKEIPPLLMGEIADVLASTNIVYKIQIIDRYFATEEMQESIKREGIAWKS